MTRTNTTTRLLASSRCLRMRSAAREVDLKGLCSDCADVLWCASNGTCLRRERGVPDMSGYVSDRVYDGVRSVSLELSALVRSAHDFGAS